MRSKGALFTLGLALLWGLGTSGVPAKQAGLFEDMVALDRSYIAALALTSQQKAKPSQRAMARLLPVWEGFQATHAEMVKRDPAWPADMARIDGYIKAADRIVKSGEPLLDAHEQLEPVRAVMLELRERNHMEYFVDHLTRFHEPMEALVLAVKGKQPKDIDTVTIARMRSELSHAQALWQQVMDAPLQAKRYGLDAAAMQQVANLKGQESRALERLASSLAADDLQALIDSGLAIKPPFAKLFMLFGDLQGVSE